MPTALEATKAWETKAAEMEAWLAPKKTDNGFDFQGDDLKAFNDRNDELAKLFDAKEVARAAEQAATKSLSLYADSQKPDRMGLFGGGSPSRAQKTEVKSLGQQFIESSGFKSYQERGREAMAGVRWDVNLDTDVSETIQASIKANLTTATNVVPYPQMGDLVPFATRRPVVADLLRQVPTDSPILMYPEETALNLNAAPVAEGAVKPLSDFTVQRVTRNVEVIAHRFKISNQALEDIPGIRDQIDQHGALGLYQAEEIQILSGDGVSPNLQGFLTKTGVQTQARGTTDPFTAFMRARTKISVIGRATIEGGVINPYDWEKIVLQKDTTGRFIYGDPFSAMADPRIWGIPFVPTDAITAGTSLVGAFKTFARLRRMGGIRIIVGYSGDDIDRNLQTIVIEERVGLEIYRAQAFATVTGLDTLTY